MTYRVVFANGEKRELLVDAEKAVEGNHTMIFLKEKHVVAAVPLEKLLYLVRVDD